MEVAIWELNMEISSHILRKSIVGPVSHSLIIKVELLVVSKAECFISSKIKKEFSHMILGLGHHTPCNYSKYNRKGGFT